MPVPEEALVSLLTLRAGEEVEQVLPPAEECPQVSLAEVARQEVEGDHCLLTRLVSVDTDHITRAEHLVAENRIRLILRDVRSGSKCYCWLFGEYSDALVRFKVKPSDLVMLRRPRVVQTKLKYKQILPADMSDWTIHCLSREKKKITFVRMEPPEEELVPGPGGGPPEDPSEAAVNALIEAMNNSDSTFTIEQVPSPPPEVENATQNIENISPNIQGPSPARNPRLALSIAQPTTPRPSYVFLAQCQTHKQKYNVWAIITELLEIPRRRKSKIVAKLLLTDESLSVTGDLREKFKFDILTDGFEQMPNLEVGSVVRIHHMTVEVFNGKSDGRVYSGHCVTVVAGGPGDIISPECTARRAGKVLVWGEEDNSRVRQLREVWAGSSVQERTLEEIKDACVSSLSCRLVEITRLAGYLVLRLEDGTVNNLNTMEFRGADTEQAREQQGDDKSWIDVWVESRDSRRDVERLMLDVGDFIRVERLTCLLIEDEQRPRSFRFSIESGSLQKLNVNSDVVKSMMVKLNDVPGESQNDSYLAKIFDAVNKDGSFVAPFTQSEAMDCEDRQPVSSTQKEDEAAPAPSLTSAPASLPSPVLSRPADTPPASQLSEELSQPSLPLAQPQPSPRSQPTSPSASPMSFTSVEVSGFTQQSSTPDKPETAGASKKRAIASPTPSPTNSPSPSPPPPIRKSGRRSTRSPQLKPGPDSSSSPAASVKLRRSRRPKAMELEESSSKLTTRVSLRKEKSSVNAKAPSLPAASSDASSEVSANLLKDHPPDQPTPPEAGQESSEVWSQMSQFLVPTSPVRTKSKKKPSESNVSSQSSSGPSCRETFSEHNYSRNIYIDDLIDNFAVDEIEEENLPVDSMEVNVGDPDALSQDNTEKNEDTDSAPESEQEEAAIQSDDIFENSQISQNSKNSPEKEISEENPPAENIVTKEPGPVAPEGNVSPEEEAEGEEGKSYRSNLVVTCDPSCSALPRRDCASLLTVAPGKYRLLCVINDVETDQLVKGYCRECGKQDDPDKFDQNETDLLCCSKDGRRVSARLKFQFVVNVHDSSVALGPANQIVMSGLSAQKFLGIRPRDFMDNPEMRGQTIGKLKVLEGKLAEFCVEKISQAKVLYASKSEMKF